MSEIDPNQNQCQCNCSNSSEESYPPKIWSFLEDNNGGFSAMRLAFLSLIFTVAFCWCYIAYTTKTMPTLPESMVTLVLGVAGTKMVQRFGEKTDSQ